MLVADQVIVADFPVVIVIGLTLSETTGGDGNVTVNGIFF